MKKIEHSGVSIQQNQIVDLLMKGFSSTDELSIEAEDLDILQQLLDESGLLKKLKKSLGASINQMRTDLSKNMTERHYLDDKQFINYFLALFRNEYGVSYDHIIKTVYISWELFENLHEE